MKSIISAALVVALLTSTAASAQPDHRDNRSGHDRGSGQHQSGKHQSGNHHSSQPAYGQQRRNGNNGRHLGWAKDRGHQHRWSRGERMGYNDWRGARTIDYRHYHLRQPPRGYEWRQRNDQFILVAVATGLIASIILSTGR